MQGAGAARFGRGSCPHDRFPIHIQIAWPGARTKSYSDWFGLFRVPQITTPDREAARAYEDRNIFFAYVLLALVVVHVVAALWHHFVRKDRVTARMIDGAPG